MSRTHNFLRGRRGSQLTDEERVALETTLGPSRSFDARTTLVEAGTLVSSSILLLDGLMCRYMDDRQGHRQLVALHVPGDFVDLHGYPLQRLDHDVATLTRVTIALAPHEALTTVTDTHPHLTRMLWFSTLLDAAMHREWIFRLGRLDALGRVAHFIAETDCRLAAIGMSDGRSFRLPLTQTDVAEACGLTSIHVSRMLRELRTQGVADFSNQAVSIFDRARLHRLAEFEPGYLYLEDGVFVP
jgi:CRP-like cAMP-binding protein